MTQTPCWDQFYVAVFSLPTYTILLQRRTHASSRGGECCDRQNVNTDGVRLDWAAAHHEGMYASFGVVMQKENSSYMKETRTTFVDC